MSKKYYRQQRCNARDRGIDFHFTYAGWCSWWEEQLGPDWAEMRGCKRGQYVMARFEDKGPYIAHNVKCVLSSDNHIERNKALWKKRHALDEKEFDKLCRKFGPRVSR